MEANFQTILAAYTGKIMTVLGPIEPGVLGLCLPHEHVMSTFGAESARYPHYDQGALFAAVLPYLQQIKGYGCRALADCTATHFGRHPEFLRSIARQSGLHILTNTGYYAAAGDRYVPALAYEESADQIAARWVRELVYSIDDTGVRPGFIKTAVDEGPLSEIDRKLVRAAASAHRQSGLAIQTHTGANWGAVQEILAILATEGLHPSAWIWVHAHQEPDADHLLAAAAQGAWISLDGLNAESSDHILTLLHALRSSGHLNQVLLSHDGDSYFGEGDFRPYDYLFTTFIPRLEAANFSPAEIQQMMAVNPRGAFTLRRRLVNR
jgi:phosphotriesterase-related protein